MRLLEFGKEASLASVIEAIKAVPEPEVTLKIPSDTPWLKNPVNEKILQKSVQQFGKKAHFEGRIESPVEPIATPKFEAAPEPITPIPVVSDLVEKDEAGFVVDGDVMQEKPVAPPQPELVINPGLEEKPVLPPVPEAKTGGRINRFKRFGKFVIRRWPFVLAAVVLLLLGLAAYVVYALPRADVKIIVAERPLEREATFTATTSVTQIDVSARKIPAKTLTSTQSGSARASTTGTKAVGTPAKGSVTFYNSTVVAKTINQGDKLSATSGSTVLKYTADATVTIPAEAPFNGTSCVTPSGCPKSADVSVTASDIGSQYDVAANTVFSWDTDPIDVKGVNPSALSGGSSRNVQVVAQSDMDSLLKSLTSQLSDKAKADVIGKNGDSTQILDKAMTPTVVSKSFDHKVGDESSDVGLSLTISITSTTYSSQDLKSFLSQTLQQASPDGYEVDTASAQTSADLLGVEQNGDLTFTGHIRANLIPKFDHDALIKNLAGKKPAAAETYLKNIPSVLSYQVNIWPNLPTAIQSFPSDVKRIHITVIVQQ